MKIASNPSFRLLFILPKSSFGRDKFMIDHSPSNERCQKVTSSLHKCILEMFGGRTSVLDGLRLRAIDAAAFLRFPCVVRTFESTRPGGEEQRTARVAFGYSPLLGCFLLSVHVTQCPVSFKGLRRSCQRVFHQWNVSPILCCSSR